MILMYNLEDNYICVNYLVKIEDVKAKHLITNALENHKFKAKVWW